MLSKRIKLLIIRISFYQFRFRAFMSLKLEVERERMRTTKESGNSLNKGLMFQNKCSSQLIAC